MEVCLDGLTKIWEWVLKREKVSKGPFHVYQQKKVGLIVRVSTAQPQAGARPDVRRPLRQAPSAPPATSHHTPQQAGGWRGKGQLGEPYTCSEVSIDVSQRLVDVPLRLYHVISNPCSAVARHLPRHRKQAKKSEV